MLPDNRNILIFEDAKPFRTLKSAFVELGFQLVAELEMEELTNFNKVIGYFSCFYHSLDYPFSAWQRRRMLAQAGIPVVAWNRDAPHYLNRQKWRLHLASTLQLFDIYATHTLIDSAKYCFAPNTVYLANALEPSVYNIPAPVAEAFSRLRDESSYAVDVSFFGAMDGARFKEDDERSRFFIALSERLKRENISHVFRETGDMSPDQQIAFIHASKINLSYGARCEYKATVASGLPERCFGIPGCGGFLLCDKRTHARGDFDVGSNWAEFDGLENCVSQIKYWLTHFQLARDLAERCYYHVMTSHTYRNRAKTLHKALLAWHADKQTDNETLLSGSSRG